MRLLKRWNWTAVSADERDAMGLNALYEETPKEGLATDEGQFVTGTGGEGKGRMWFDS